jgi:phosphatidylglycerophosphate synthase
MAAAIRIAAAMRLAALGGDQRRSAVMRGESLMKPAWEGKHAGPMSAVEVYRKTRKLPDFAWNLYVCRPVAAVFVAAVRDTRLTPNQITLAAFAVAVVSVAMVVGLPGYWGFVAAIAVFELSYVLDCADGMLARWRGIQSTQGHLLDFLMDEIKAFMVLGAIAIRMWRERGDALFLLIGIAGLVALASGIALTTFSRRPEIAGVPAPAGEARPRSLLRRALGVVESAARLLIHYPSYILFVALIGRIELYLYPYVAVNALYAVRAFASVALRFGRS